MRSTWAAATLALLWAGTARAKEVPADGLPAWEEVAVAPDWLEAPPAREGFVRVVNGGQGTPRDLANPAASYPHDEGLRAFIVSLCRLECARRLRPVLGRDSDAVVERGVTEAALARRASHIHMASGPVRPRMAKYSAWALWDVPIGPLLEAVAEAQRAAAKERLVAAGEGASVPWHEGPTPAWVAKPEPREGHALVLVAERSATVDLAKADLATLGPQRVTRRLVAALDPVVGSRAESVPAARTAASWRSLRARTVRREGAEGIAWAAWDVPIDPILERLPEESRAAARRALEGFHRSD